MGCSSAQILGVAQAEDPQDALRLLGFSSGDIQAVWQLHQQVSSDNADAFTLQALAAFTKIGLSPFVLRLFRVSAAAEVLDLRRFLTGLW